MEKYRVKYLIDYFQRQIDAGELTGNEIVYVADGNMYEEPKIEKCKPIKNIGYAPEGTNKKHYLYCFIRY